MINVLLKCALIAKRIVAFIHLATRSSAHTFGRNVLLVVLLVNFSPVFSEAIDPPRFVEGGMLAFGQGMTELRDGGLQRWEPSLQFGLYDAMFFRPIARYRIEADESFQHSSAKLGVSCAPGIEALNSECAKETNGGGQQGEKAGRGASDRVNERIHAFLLGLVLVAIPMAPVFLAESRRRNELKKPNVEVRGGEKA